MKKDLFSKAETESSSFSSFLKKMEGEISAFKEKPSSDEQNTHTLSTFFIELVHRIKNPLVSIKTFTQLLREKFNDAEYRDQFYRVVTEDIERIDSVLNGLMNYIKIITPVEKTNTIHFVLEDILKKHEAQLKAKQIKIFKKYEKDLPETTVHEEQLRYIFNSLLEYIIPFIPPSGGIGFLTKSLNTHKETDPRKILLKEDSGHIEIMIVFTGFKKPSEPLKTVLGIPAPQQEEAIELELRLIKEIIQKNRGMMKFEFNEKKPRTFISLKFPIERRKVIYYPSTSN
jgi:signal transduction histidine kinase